MRNRKRIRVVWHRKGYKVTTFKDTKESAQPYTAAGNKLTEHRQKLLQEGLNFVTGYYRGHRSSLYR